MNNSLLSLLYVVTCVFAFSKVREFSLSFVTPVSFFVTSTLFISIHFYKHIFHSASTAG